MSATQRVIEFVTTSKLGGLLLRSLPDTVAETIREIGADVATSRGREVHAGDVGPGARIAGASFVLGDVHEGGTVRGVNVVKGNILGGDLKAVNLLIGEVRGGALRAVNVLVGNVHGGSFREVHLIVGNVYGGSFDRCYTVIGDLYGGSGRIARLLGTAHDGAIDVMTRL